MDLDAFDSDVVVIQWSIIKTTHGSDDLMEIWDIDVTYII